jgi:hypothetical protein
MMTGFLLAVVSAVAGPSVLGGRLRVSLVAFGLVTAGLFCGVTLIAVTAPGGSRRDRPRAPVPAPVPPPAGDGLRATRGRGTHGRRRAPAAPRSAEPDPSEEWMDALRPPGPPPVTGPIPVTRPPAGPER